jgi:ABC-type transport system involved in multi-copper enzyme maturation permease subunit
MPRSLLSASFRVMDISIGEMLWSRRTIFMALVVAAPVVIAGVTRLLASVGLGMVEAHNVRLAGPTIFGMMIWIFYLRFIVPVLAVFYGTSLIADEVEDKTITYLFVRPVPRAAVLIGKYFSYLLCTTFVVLPSVVLVYLLVVPVGGGSLGAVFLPLLSDLLLLFLGLAVYGAVFAFVGARIKRPLLIGLAFVIAWEPMAMLIPGYVRRLTVAYYLQALVPHAMPQDSASGLLAAIFQQTPPLAVSLLWLALIWAAFMWMGVRTVETREYVLEQ